MRAIENASKYFQRTLENTIPDFLEDIEGILEELKKGGVKELSFKEYDKKVLDKELDDFLGSVKLSKKNVEKLANIIQGYESVINSKEDSLKVVANEYKTSKEELIALKKKVETWKQKDIDFDTLRRENKLLQEELESRNNIIGNQEDNIKALQGRLSKQDELIREQSEKATKTKESWQKEKDKDIIKLEKFIQFLYSELTNYINLSNAYLINEKARHDLFATHVNKFNEDWEDFLKEQEVVQFKSKE